MSQSDNIAILDEMNRDLESKEEALRKLQKDIDELNVAVRVLSRYHGIQKEPINKGRRSEYVAGGEEYLSSRGLERVSKITDYLVRTGRAKANKKNPLATRVTVTRTFRRHPDKFREGKKSGEIAFALLQPQMQLNGTKGREKAKKRSSWL